MSVRPFHALEAKCSVAQRAAWGSVVKDPLFQAQTESPRYVPDNAKEGGQKEGGAQPREETFHGKEIRHPHLPLLRPSEAASKGIQKRFQVGHLCEILLFERRAPPLALSSAQETLVNFCLDGNDSSTLPSCVDLLTRGAVATNNTSTFAFGGLQVGAAALPKARSRQSLRAEAVPSPVIGGGARAAIQNLLVPGIFFMLPVQVAGLPSRGLRLA